MKTLILKNRKSYDAYMHYLLNKHVYMNLAKGVAEAGHLVMHFMHVM